MMVRDDSANCWPLALKATKKMSPAPAAWNAASGRLLQVVGLAGFFGSGLGKADRDFPHDFLLIRAHSVRRRTAGYANEGKNQVIDVSKGRNDAAEVSLSSDLDEIVVALGEYHDG